MCYLGVTFRVTSRNLGVTIFSWRVTLGYLGVTFCGFRINSCNLGVNFLRWRLTLCNLGVNCCRWRVYFTQFKSYFFQLRSYSRRHPGDWSTRTIDQPRIIDLPILIWTIDQPGQLIYLDNWSTFNIILQTYFMINHMSKSMLV